MAYHDPSIVVQGLPIENATVGYIDIDAIERARNTITFCAGNPNTEMLKVSQEGFWVRGVKVEQDAKEAETVYNAFKAWMMWAKLNER